MQEAVSALHVTVTEDKPAAGAVVLVDQLENLVTDLSGTVEEADARAAQIILGSQLNGPSDQSRIALREIHGLINRFTALYADELSAHDPIAQLLEMGRERGREWRDWSKVVKTAIERCAAPMKAAASAIMECWSDLAERLTRNSVSVQATNIGQHITLREDQLELKT
ncbi:MAG TPA: hypothetical protein VJU77_00655 [Chthoniobacterales bacterium]|nr:hypothetical protein [Chthoniobacterales bacterium]